MNDRIKIISFLIFLFLISNSLFSKNLSLLKRADLLKELVSENQEIQMNVTKPTLNFWRFIGEVLVSSIGGTAGGIAGIKIGINSFGCGNEMNCMKNEKVLICFYTGYILCSASGVFIVGNIGDETGSYLATLGGSFAGALLYGFSSSHDFTGFLVLVGPIGSTIAFNQTRKYKTPLAPKTGFINYKAGEMSLAVPQIYFRQDGFEGKTMTQQVDLVKVRF